MFEYPCCTYTVSARYINSSVCSCIPSHLYSDNAKSFIAGGEILQKALVSVEYRAKFDAFDILHVKIPLYSAWVGATWEHLIRTVKSCLYESIGRSKLSYFELLTVITDVQNAVNSRPLTYRSSDNDLETITPNFLKADPDCNVILRFDEDPVRERGTPPPHPLEIPLLMHYL